MSSRLFSLTAVLCGIAVMGLWGCSDVTEPTVPKYQTKLAANELRNSEFGKEFPQQYETYLRNNQANETEALKTMTLFKGSIPFRKNDNVNPLPKGYRQAAQPYLKNLWTGYPFMYEYNEARGHTYAVEDILHIDRINRYGEQAGLPATCWNCKTAKIPSWVEQYGDDKFWSMNFNEFRTPDKISMKDNTIGCANCHDPKTMELAITSIPLQEALQRQGKDWKTMSRNEKRALVCGQCHVEYYFMEKDYGPNKKPIFPWDNGKGDWVTGKDPEEIYQYYNDKGPRDASGKPTQFADWVHPVSKTKMLKAQHPEYEMWINGPHGAAGVTCADCHMPYLRLDGKKKVSSHQWTSPLRNPDFIENACRQCHSDKTAEYLKGRVEATQKKTYQQLLTAQDMSVKAHEAIRRASEWTGEKSADYDKLMAQAREWNRKSQFFWDYVSAENSVGFHNPVKALDTLALSQQYSQKAVDAACAATNYGISKDLAGDIHEIVPPILEWSREMQMDPANLEKHVWTRYLKPLPKADLMWKLQDKIPPKPAPVSAAPAAPTATAAK